LGLFLIEMLRYIETKMAKSSIEEWPLSELKKTDPITESVFSIVVLFKLIFLFLIH
jgi:hypothetical protein